MMDIFHTWEKLQRVRLKEPTEEELVASFNANAKSGKLGGRDLEVYLNGARVLCKIMKYLVQIGITPQLVFSKTADITDEDEERQLEVRREASDFVRKIISGDSLCDPTIISESHHHYVMIIYIHIDPVELVCAVTERSRTFTVLVTLNKIGLGLPKQLQQVWQGKLKAVQQSPAQMTTCLRSLDPSEREIAKEYVRAIGDAPPTEERASASTKESDATKKRRKK